VTSVASVFFFSSRRRHTSFSRDWSSDVCSSDLDNFNLGLSQKRADTCVSYLVSKGVAKDRLEARGMGETEPFQIPEEYTSYGARSEERRVGKEGRHRGSRADAKEIGKVFWHTVD